MNNEKTIKDVSITSTKASSKDSIEKLYILDFIPGKGAILIPNLNNPDLTTAKILELQDGLRDLFKPSISDVL